MENSTRLIRIQITNQLKNSAYRSIMVMWTHSPENRLRTSQPLVHSWLRWVTVGPNACSLPCIRLDQAKHDCSVSSNFLRNPVGKEKIQYSKNVCEMILNSDLPRLNSTVRNCYLVWGRPAQRSKLRFDQEGLLPCIGHNRPLRTNVAFGDTAPLVEREQMATKSQAKSFMAMLWMICRIWCDARTDMVFPYFFTFAVSCMRMSLNLRQLLSTSSKEGSKGEFSLTLFENSRTF